MPRVITFGCRLNALESEILRENAQKLGLRDVILINSCAVTAEAERQVRQAVRKAIREHPDRRVIVTGCSVDIDLKPYLEIPGVVGVLPNARKLDVEALRPFCKQAETKDCEGQFSYPASRARAYVAIQNGCNHFCSYCIIPHTRGKSHSMPLEKILFDVRAAVQKGYIEVVLTGIDIAAYGKEEELTLGRLVSHILQEVPDLPQLRLSSLDPAAIDNDLLQAFATEERLMPHVHLSLQSMSTSVLKAMRRRHTQKSALDMCYSLRKARPDIVLGADLIAGFPTETEADFEETLKTLPALRLAFLHAFPYSKRPNTLAATMLDLSRSVILERARRLRLFAHEALQICLQQHIGQTLPVLIEHPLKGRTPHFMHVTWKEPVHAQSLIPMHITGCQEEALVATFSKECSTHLIL
ncbi:MAG: tRNA (N(6)-L-threonylcarbamoyladenosine(37)-C(2))-methylthiotransferase MtaB [Holosporales bacterium]|jgi:threonylcarbamoyladenosine tRNA methylthiotransferase MtaB|nr:tRNA (N(6)-L-threonylcarbamoyladenosine(37)-C(2))-methylthiotransferase MtaB [Holosporales bacterium]